MVVGNKLPVSYYFRPKEEENKAPHLVAEIDINSEVAKAVLNLCISCTKSLIIDLGFLIQGDQADQLPEQMMVGTKLHRLDLSAAPPFPSQSCGAT